MCSRDYIPIADDCFYFSGRDRRVKLNWHLAQEKCHGRGDQLAVPGNVEAFLKYVANMNITNADFYVGGQYKYQQKVWKWVNKSNITMDDEFWVDRSPCEYSNDNGTHCLAIFANVAKFRGKPCENSHSYICQRLNKSMLSNHLLNHHGIGNTLEPIATYYGQYNLYYIIGAILLVLGLLALAVIIYVCRKRKQSQAKIKESKYIADPSVNQPTRHDSENSLYGQACSTGSNLSARHDSENSLYGQT